MKRVKKNRRESLNSYNRKYWATHPERRENHKWDHRARRYGVTKDAFLSMLSGQGGVCAICGTSDWPSTGPCVDHDHDTGLVRGILCHHCNAAIGMLKDSPAIALAATEYLKRGV